MENEPAETLSDIRRLMERSSRFHLLSGFSLVAAGICGVVGVWWARLEIMHARALQPGAPGTKDQLAGSSLPDCLILIACCTLITAILSGYLFTGLKVRKMKLPLWDVVVRRVTLHFAIPFAAGGVFVIGMIIRHEYHFIATACLLFYGLALINASHYTLRAIYRLGILEILLAFACLFSGYALLSLILGFGVMNIIAGLYIRYRKQ